MVKEIGTLHFSDGSMSLHVWRVEAEPTGSRPLRRHSHPRFEISYVENGSGIYTVGKRTYEMQKGDVFVFSAGEQHSITCIGEGLTLINLHFEPRYLWGNAADRLSDEHIGLCFFHKESFSSRIESADALPLVSHLRAIEAELLGGEAEHSLAVKSHLNLLLISLIREFDYAGRAAAMDREHLHTVRRVMTYIDGHFTENLTLAELSHLAGLSPNYLSAFFRRISGSTLWDYIGAKRIDCAVSLILSDDTLSITEIAERCGYNSSANFNKAFKKQTGMTPREYRKCGGGLT